MGAVFSANRIVTLIVSLILGSAFYLFLMSTRTGKAIRAAAQDPDAAELMGVRINRVLALCFGFGAMMAALGGLLLSMTSDHALAGYGHAIYPDRHNSGGPWRIG